MACRSWDATTAITVVGSGFGIRGAEVWVGPAQCPTVSHLPGWEMEALVCQGMHAVPELADIGGPHPPPPPRFFLAQDKVMNVHRYFLVPVRE